MANPCTALRSHPEAHNLCRFLVDRRLIPKRNLDRGVPYLDFRKVTPNLFSTKPTISIVPETRGNGKIEPGEVYAYALRLLEQEQTFGGKQPARWSLSQHLTRLTSFRPPWILNDFNPRTRYDEKLRTLITGAIARIQKSLNIRGMRHRNAKYNAMLTRALVDWIVKPRNQGGLGVVPDQISSAAVTSERTALDILTSRNRKAHCSELNYILYEIFRQAGLKAKFLLVYRDDVGADSLLHYCIGVQLDPRSTKITPVDLTYYKRSHWIDTPHETTAVLPAATMLAMYFNNKGSMLFNMNSLRRLMTSSQLQKRIATNLQRAMSYDQYFPLFHLNLAKYHILVKNDAATSRLFLQSALRLYPHTVSPTPGTLPPLSARRGIMRKLNP